MLINQVCKSISIVTVCCLSIGCASISGSNSQSLSLETRNKEGVVISGVNCTLTNDKGSYFTMTPNPVQVRKSSKDLRILCEKDGLNPGTTTVASSVNGGMFGNLIFGGGVGAIIDHSKGTAYDYPELIPVEMGRTLNLGKGTKKYMAQRGTAAG